MDGSVCEFSEICILIKQASKQASKYSIFVLF